MKALIAIVVVLIVVVGGYFLVTHKAAAPTSPVATSTEPIVAPAATTVTNSTTTTTTPAPKTATITYTDTGFSPKSVTVTAGTEVTWVNDSSEQLWVASNPHPIHNGYDGTTVSQHCVNNAPTSNMVFDECTLVGKGGTFTFTADKVGTWGYHNHADHGMTGTLVIAAAQ